MTYDDHGRVLIKTADHWFASRDASAGVRLYDGTRGGVTFWHGFLDRKSIEHTTGLRLVSEFVSCSVQEHFFHDLIIDRVIATLGRPPLTFCKQFR